MEEKEIVEKSEVEKLNDEWNEKYLRLYAEFDNYKKRVAREKVEIEHNIKSRMITSILDVDSDLHIAESSIKDEDSKKGFRLIISKLDSFLKSQNIESIQTDTYDSDLHEVISIAPIGKNKIALVSKGYKLNGKPIRYPKVILGE